MDFTIRMSRLLVIQLSLAWETRCNITHSKNTLKIIKDIICFRLEITDQRIQAMEIQELEAISNRVLLGMELEITSISQMTHLTATSKVGLPAHLAVCNQGPTML